MKTINMYYVKDMVEEKCITTLLPASNHLTACLGFRNAYITNTENKIPYKNLKMICCGQFLVNENGEYTQDVSYPHWELSGSEIIGFIREQIADKGLDDGFLDEEDD